MCSIYYRFLLVSIITNVKICIVSIRINIYYYHRHRTASSMTFSVTVTHLLASFLQLTHSECRLDPIQLEGPWDVNGDSTISLLESEASTI